MSGGRTPWWGHNATEESLRLGRIFTLCRDGCGARIILAMSPRGPNGKPGSWIPLEQIGFDEQTGQRIMEIHHGNCVNTRVPGLRDPERSHRITVNEDVPAEPEDQQHFRFRKPAVEQGA